MKFFLRLIFVFSYGKIVNFQITFFTWIFSFLWLLVLTWPSYIKRTMFVFEITVSSIYLILYWVFIILKLKLLHASFNLLIETLIIYSSQLPRFKGFDMNYCVIYNFWLKITSKINFVLQQSNLRVFIVIQILIKGKRTVFLPKLKKTFHNNCWI